MNRSLGGYLRCFVFAIFNCDINFTITKSFKIKYTSYTIKKCPAIMFRSLLRDTQDIWN